MSSLFETCLSPGTSLKIGSTDNIEVGVRRVTRLKRGAIATCYTGTTNIQVIQPCYRVPPMHGQMNEGKSVIRLAILTHYQAHPETEAPVPQAAHSGCYPSTSYLALCSSCLDASPRSTSDDRQQHSELGGIHQRSRGHATLPLWVAPIAASLPA